MLSSGLGVWDMSFLIWGLLFASAAWYFTQRDKGTAELGYRVAQHAAGHGVATATVRELCRLAAARPGLRTLRAATARENAASQKVLAKAGFVPAGRPARPASAVNQAPGISAT